MKKTKEEYSIIVDHVDKKFKLVYDKPFTLKERLVFWNKTKVAYHEVLKDINLKIKNLSNKWKNKNQWKINITIRIRCRFSSRFYGS